MPVDGRARLESGGNLEGNWLVPYVALRLTLMEEATFGASVRGKRQEGWLGPEVTWNGKYREVDYRAAMINTRPGSWLTNVRTF